MIFLSEWPEAELLWNSAGERLPVATGKSVATYLLQTDTDPLDSN